MAQTTHLNRKTGALLRPYKSLGRKTYAEKYRQGKNYKKTAIVLEQQTLSANHFGAQPKLATRLSHAVLSAGQHHTEHAGYLLMRHPHTIILTPQRHTMH